MSFSHWGAVLFENPMGEYKEIEGTISAFKELSDLTIFSSESNPSGQKKKLPNPPWLSRSPSGNGSLRTLPTTTPLPNLICLIISSCVLQRACYFYESVSINFSSPPFLLSAAQTESWSQAPVNRDYIDI